MILNKALLQGLSRWEEWRRIIDAFYPKGVEFCSYPNFRDQVEILLEELNLDDFYWCLSDCVFPFFLPQIKTKDADVGEVLEDFILPAVRNSYVNKFEGRWMKNYRRRDLKGQIKIESEKNLWLIQEMKKRFVVGLMIFPLHDLPIEFARSQIARMSQSFVLADPISTGTVIGAYPECLVASSENYCYSSAAVSCRYTHSGCTYYFGPGNNSLAFDYGGNGRRYVFPVMYVGNF